MLLFGVPWPHSLFEVGRIELSCEPTPEMVDIVEQVVWTFMPKEQKYIALCFRDGKSIKEVYGENAKGISLYLAEGVRRRLKTPTRSAIMHACANGDMDTSEKYLRKLYGGTPLCYLDLPAGIFNALDAADICTIDELSAIPIEERVALPRLSYGYLKPMSDKLVKLGYPALRMGLPDCVGEPAQEVPICSQCAYIGNDDVCLDCVHRYRHLPSRFERNRRLYQHETIK